MVASVKSIRLYEQLMVSSTNETLIESLRAIKNSIIGNPTRKQNYLTLGISSK